jgi:hypothetical protein
VSFNNKNMEKAVLEQAITDIDRTLFESYGVEFDENGQPIWYDHDEVFVVLAQKLLDYYGEPVRQSLNESLSIHNMPTL